MERKRRYGLLVLLAIGGLAAGMLVSYRLVSQEEKPSRTPFIAVVIEKHFDQYGNLARLPGGILQITYGRKSDGSEVRFESMQDPDGSFTLLRNVFDASGKEMIFQSSTTSVTTFYVGSVHVGHHLSNFESCPPAAEDPSAPHPTRLGYSVVEVTTEYTNRQGIERDDRWMAPTLNCFALADTNTSLFGARNESEAISVFEGEPPEAWFTVPKGYTETSPSQVAAAFATRFPGHKFMSDQMAALGDRTYYLHRTPIR